MLPLVPFEDRFITYDPSSKIVYLIDSLLNQTAYQAKSWRLTVSSELNNKGVRTFSPKLLSQPYDLEHVFKGIDYADYLGDNGANFHNADIVFANLYYGESASLVLAMLAASMQTKPVVVICPEGDVERLSKLGIITYCTSNYQCAILSILKLVNNPKMTKRVLKASVEDEYKASEQQLADHMVKRLDK